MNPIAEQNVAVCPEHPQRASLAPCQRCGRFMCEECTASRTPPYCTGCAERYQDPLGVLAKPFSIVSALGNGWTLFVRTLPRLLPVALIFGGLAGLLTYFLHGSVGKDTANMITRLFDATIGLIADGAFLAVMVGEAEGAPRDVATSLKEGLSAWPRLFGARFRSGLVILVFTLMLVVPGIMKALSLAVVTEAAYREPGSDALENSTSLTEGRRWEILGLFMISFAAVFLSMFPLGFIGGTVLRVAPRSAIVVDVLLGAAYQLVGAFASGVSLALFYGLKRSTGQELEPLPPASGESGALNPSP